MMTWLHLKYIFKPIIWDCWRKGDFYSLLVFVSRGLANPEQGDAETKVMNWKVKKIGHVTLSTKNFLG
jgi:hypothetical protein